MSRYRVHRFRWRATASVGLVISAFVFWQYSLAYIKSPSPADLNKAHPLVKPKPFYDLAAINADPTYYQRADASRLYMTAPKLAGQTRFEELVIVGEPFRLALPSQAGSPGDVRSFGYG
jgi:hypothetical protein